MPVATAVTDHDFWRRTFPLKIRLRELGCCWFMSHQPILPLLIAARVAVSQDWQDWTKPCCKPTKTPQTNEHQSNPHITVWMRSILATDGYRWWSPVEDTKGASPLLVDWVTQRVQKHLVLLRRAQPWKLFHQLQIPEQHHHSDGSCELFAVATFEVMKHHPSPHTGSCVKCVSMIHLD